MLLLCGRVPKDAPEAAAIYEGVRMGIDQVFELTLPREIVVEECPIGSYCGRTECQHYIYDNFEDCRFYQQVERAILSERMHQIRRGNDTANKPTGIQRAGQ